MTTIHPTLVGLTDTELKANAVEIIGLHQQFGLIEAKTTVERLGKAIETGNRNQLHVYLTRALNKHGEELEQGYRFNEFLTEAKKLADEAKELCGERAASYPEFRRVERLIDTKGTNGNLGVDEYVKVLIEAVDQLWLKLVLLDVETRDAAEAQADEAAKINELISRAKFALTCAEEILGSWVSPTTSAAIKSLNYYIDDHEEVSYSERQRELRMNSYIVEHALRSKLCLEATAIRKQLIGYQGNVNRDKKAKFLLFLARLAALKSAGTFVELLDWWNSAQQKQVKYAPKAA